MRYAVISDIHGNLPAFEAVLRDAEQQRIDRYLFLGDYYADMPFPNETADLIKSIKNAYVVRGNKEKYLKGLMGQDQSKWVHDMLAPLYWGFQAFRPDNLQYMIGLPEKIEITEENGTYITIFHSPAALFPYNGIRELSSSNFAQKMRSRPFTHEEYLAYADKLLKSDNEFMAALVRLPKGIYLFGHTHIQWHLEIEDRLLINPGSCGFPLDFNNAAAYTVLDTGACRKVEERRVSYDIEDAVNKLKNSGLYKRAKPWGDIMTEHMRKAEDRINDFFRLLRRHAQERGDGEKPYTNETWRSAAALWYEETQPISED
jgi:predicted phosphodiesterase